MNTKEITLKLPIDYLEGAFKKMFKDECADDMSKVIFGVLKDNPYGLEMIYKASLGIMPKPKYKVGDEVLVNQYSLDSWKFNIDEMRNRGYAIESNVKVKIVEVNIFNKEQYAVSYKYWSSTDNQTKTNGYRVEEKAIEGYVELLPLDL